jgi:hypothetical protein
MFVPLVSVFCSGGGIFLRGLRLPVLALCNLHYEKSSREGIGKDRTGEFAMSVFWGRIFRGIRLQSFWLILLIPGVGFRVSVLLMPRTPEILLIQGV